MPGCLRGPLLACSAAPLPRERRRPARVEEAARALNYVTNSAARALVTGRSEIVGATVHGITDPFFCSVVRGLQDAAVADGLVVLVGNDDRDAVKLEGYLTMLLSQKPTGVVLIGGQLRDPAATLPVARPCNVCANRACRSWPWAATSSISRM